MTHDQDAYKPFPDRSTTLLDYVESLLRRGLRGKDEEFQLLMNFWGEEKIRSMATGLMKKWRDEEKRGSPPPVKPSEASHGSISGVSSHDNIVAAANGLKEGIDKTYGEV